jgi:hypothetical protein
LKIIRTHNLIIRKYKSTHLKLRRIIGYQLQLFSILLRICVRLCRTVSTQRWKLSVIFNISYVFFVVRSIEFLCKYLVIIDFNLWFLHTLIHKVWDFAWITRTFNIYEFTICPIMNIWWLILLISCVSWLKSLHDIFIRSLVNLIHDTRLQWCNFIILSNAYLLTWYTIWTNTALVRSTIWSFLPLAPASSLVLLSTVWS